MLSVTTEHTRILVRDIALPLSQLPGERVSWGMAFVGSWPHTADNMKLRFQVTSGPFGDNHELLKPVSLISSSI